MCCGRKPGPLRADRGVSPGVPPTPAAGGAVLTPRGAPAPGTVMLRHRHPRPVLVRGPVTGRAYVFSVAAPAQPVDPRDADALLRTGQFLRDPDPGPGPRGTGART